LELMALIQNDIENGLFDVAADYLGDVERRSAQASDRALSAARRLSRESTTGARSMIAFNATRNVLMLMSDARPTRGPGRPKKTGPYAAELRGATIHPVVKEFTEWRLKNGLSQQKAVELLQRYHFSVTQSAIRNWEEGRHSPRDHTAAILAQFLAERSKRRK
jgi:Helix-turn-helix